ncbi:MAG: ribosome-associated translation inhibitor RaiA [Eubacteriales bacterium]|nr:ribosome-associated translation inhibitor RaiA [Eubacteriales bacterium]
MNYILSGKNIEVTPALKQKVIKKLSKLEKFFNPETDVQVTMSVERNRHIIEVTIPFKGMLIRAEDSTTDMYASIDNVIDKIERQIRKNKTRIQRQILDVLNAEYFESPGETNDEGDYKIVRSKKFAIKPMDEQEAILQMNLLGHDFFMFENSETNRVNVVYKRHDGNYGLIEPEY